MYSPPSVLIFLSDPLPTHVIVKLFSAYAKLGIRDSSLFERLLAHYSRFIYDYPPNGSALMAKLFLQTLPHSLPHLGSSMDAAEESLMGQLNTFSLEGV